MFNQCIFIINVYKIKINIYVNSTHTPSHCVITIYTNILYNLLLYKNAIFYATTYICILLESQVSLLKNILVLIDEINLKRIRRCTAQIASPPPSG